MSNQRLMGKNLALETRNIFLVIYFWKFISGIGSVPK